MDDLIGMAVVFLIISVLTYALFKQIKFTKSIDMTTKNPLIRKQLKRKNKLMTVTLFAILLFYTMNVLSSLNSFSSMPISNNDTALGTFLSFISYLYAKFSMTIKECGS